ncbi:hypothetical protein VP1G_05032 [Cytospora mali]|uniref:DUF7514 domain-containing protein n=1 Tax=Cytospora mali TaxID=578113 RepID=A0A194V199_CYTMA|nr:hypothetical protein VP1G_05032 [Valsa mali var. pyri (nom. inval.)]
MSRYEGDANQHKEKERPPTLKSTDWNTLHGSVKAQKNTEDVSPRSKGEIPLSDKQTEEIRRRIEEAKERAKTSSTAELPPRPANQAAQSSATARSKSDTPPRPDLSSVSPELLKELRKIVREEVEQLNNGEKTFEPPEPGKSSRPLGASSSAQPRAGAQQPTPATASKDVDDKKASSTATASPQNSTQTKESPRQSTVRFSDETKPAVPIIPRGNNDESKKAATSKVSNIEMTAIDQRWGTLFEKNGSPTRRMEHVVQGLANYIINEFIPQESIVITPEKMAAFYSYHRLDKEVFPFTVLFKSRSKDFNKALAGLYEDIGCQYFLVPTDVGSRPTVPGLTPTGFAHWLVTMIQAYPDEEAKRLDKIVSDLPIEADSFLDGKPERLPKQISRYLLPEKSLRSSHKLVDEAMRNFTEDINNTSTAQSKGSGNGGGGSSKPPPIVLSQERRPSTTTGTGATSRYIPEALSEKNKAEEGFSGHDRDRRTTSTSTSSRDTRDHDNSRKNSIPPPPGPGHLGRTHSLDNSGRSVGRPPHASSSTAGPSRAPTASSSSSRKNRSPQRKPHSQSVPAGIDRIDVGTDRARGPSTIASVAATVAAAVLGSSSHIGGSATAPAPAQSASSSDTSNRGSRTSGGDFVIHRDKRASLDESTPRGPASAWNIRDKAGLESSSSSSGGRSAKRKSMVLPDLKGPTWDDYLKSSAPKSATSAFMKKG